MAAGVFLLLGPEDGQKDDFVDGLKKDITKKNGEPPEEYRFYPFNAEYAAIVAILRNNALFSKHRFVVLNEAHDIKKPADIETLADYCLRPADDATFVLISDQYQVDKRLSKAVPKDGTKVFWELFENKKQSWIIDYFRKAGFAVETEAVNLLLELVENDTRDLKRECERLALFMAGSPTITADSVEELVYHSKEENVFTLFDHIAVGDFPGSLEILQSLRLSGSAEPAQVMGGLVWQFERLLSVKRYVENRHSVEEALNKANIKGKKNGRTYAEACKTYTARELESILTLIAGYEADFRSGTADLEDTELQIFLYDIVIRKGRSATALPARPAG